VRLIVDRDGDGKADEAKVFADGRTVTGVVKVDDGDTLQLVTPEGQTVTVKKAEIDEQKRGNSAMPEDLVKFLNKRELRDLVEFLSTALRGDVDMRRLSSREDEEEAGGHELAK
jgi:hypothetical protein